MTKQKQSAVGLKQRTNLKAGECCWGAFNRAQRSNNREDWREFYRCCDRDPNCTLYK